MSANRNKSVGGIGMGQMPGLKIGERGEMEGFRRKPSNVEGVKGSEYIRHYYKCAHPKCPVKITEERSPAVQTTKTIHEGLHNHEGQTTWKSLKLKTSPPSIA